LAVPGFFLSRRGREYSSERHLPVIFGRYRFPMKTHGRKQPAPVTPHLLKALRALAGGFSPIESLVAMSP
jgi:hypothetical protein